MLPGEVKGDLEFTAFQWKLATAVANSRASGNRIGSGPGCRCPLGAHPEALSTFPFARMARDGGWREVAEEDLVQFINGFGLDEYPNRGTGTYGELGRAYREMFP